MVMRQYKGKPTYPFSAVVGQDGFKLALTLAAVHPGIGGVLVGGPRGSAKSTLARALADIIPSASKDCFVTLPLGASEEMVTGTLDLQQVLNDRKVSFSPGLLAKAHQGVLYVDEVNLLNDALVDLLLDVSVSGVNCVERDGISHKHAAEFVLLGTMNPDEGELRPQLHDRFGLAVDLSAKHSVDERIEIVRRREAYDSDPSAFCGQYQTEQQGLSERIQRARSRLKSIECSDDLRLIIAQRCEQANVEGLRADIVWYRAALAHAALCNRSCVTIEDVELVEELVLCHRRRAFDDESGSAPQPPPSAQNPYQRPQEDSAASHSKKENETNGQWGSFPPQTQITHDVADLSLVLQSSVPKRNSASTNNGSGIKGNALGRGSYSQLRSSSPNWFETISNACGQWPLEELKFKKARGGQSMLNFVLLDTSASTLGTQLLSKAKGVVLQIANQAYLRREQLTIVGFGNDKSETILPRVRAPKHIRRRLDQVTAGGGTPIHHALNNAQCYLHKLVRRMPGLMVKCFLITDGRSRQSLSDISLPGECTVIDIESSNVKRGRGQTIASELGAKYLALSGRPMVIQGGSI